ncbi:MAG: class I SAM-dependent RNA methyltransferase [Desulfobulbaceae bacterium]|nr:class I SAM-dependent RNA methyltransferase [Desulfobulbaceae bacterium]
MQLEHTIEIQKIITGGSGLGHLENGMVVMTPFVLPGEQVTVTEIQRFSGHIQAKTLNVVQSSPKRQAPFCPLYTICGGCALQHTPYLNQLAIKKEILVETLRRGHVLPEEDIPTPLPSPDPEGYRYKIRLHVAKNGTIGFHKMQSHELVEIKHCPLAAPALNTALLNLHNTGLLPELAPLCRQIELVCSPADDAVVATVYLSSARQPSKSLQQKILAQAGLRGLAFKSRKKTNFFPEPVSLQQGFSTGNQSYTLTWDSRCFFQVNPKQNRQLVELVLTGAGAVAGKKILDLFCGMGNFSVPLSLAGAEITGIELNKYSIHAARKNARNAGIQGDHFIPGDVGRHLQQLVNEKARFDIVVLDPPRQGLGRETQLLPQLQPEKILYISCDPATLTRDLQTLIRKGYGLKSVTPVDMFPQTHHIECLAVLEKN